MSKIKFNLEQKPLNKTFARIQRINGKNVSLCPFDYRIVGVDESYDNDRYDFNNDTIELFGTDILIIPLTLPYTDEIFEDYKYPKTGFVLRVDVKVLPTPTRISYGYADWGIHDVIYEPGVHDFDIPIKACEDHEIHLTFFDPGVVISSKIQFVFNDLIKEEWSSDPIPIPTFDYDGASSTYTNNVDSALNQTINKRNHFHFKKNFWKYTNTFIAPKKDVKYLSWLNELAYLNNWYIVGYITNDNIVDKTEAGILVNDDTFNKKIYIDNMEILDSMSGIYNTVKFTHSEVL